MKKPLGRLLFFIVFLLLSGTFYTARASHLAGQDFTYIFVDSSAGICHYRVTFTLYADCLNGQPDAILEDNPIFLGVFDGVGGLVELDTNIYYSSADTMSVGAITCTGDAVATYCRLKRTFIKDYYLPLSPSGYVVVYERCCWYYLADFPDANDSGTAATCYIPPSGMAVSNNSAIFTHYPPFAVLIDSPLALDCSATDADGDSLSYELCMPYTYNVAGSGFNSKPYPTAPPFLPFVYSAPLSYSNPISSAVPLAIDPVSGLFTCTPNTLGTCLITVCCHEWRHGVLINTVQREFELIVGDCGLSVPNLSQAPLSVFPNPAATEITISAAGKISHVTIINILGQTMYSQACDLQKQTIDVSGFIPGLYFAKINGTEVIKFIKQ